MRYSITKIVGIGLALSLALPMLAQAATLTQDQINSVLTLLQSFNVSSDTVATVQAVLNGQPPPRQGGDQNEGGGPPWGMPPGQFAKEACITLTRNLGIGSQGDDVMKLQQLLAQDPNSGFIASTTGFFGPLTARAMARFQMENGIASSTTGVVGPLTRGFFERSCGRGLGGGEGHMSNPGMMGSTSSSTNQ